VRTLHATLSKTLFKLPVFVPAIKIDEVNVVGYTAWSFMDNFEWAQGYTERFGLHWVDFNDPKRPRIPKKSTECYKEIMAMSFPAEGLPACNTEQMNTTIGVPSTTASSPSKYNKHEVHDNCVL